MRAMHFPAGSMEPKVLSRLPVRRSHGTRAVIGKLDDSEALLDGDSGTSVVLDAQDCPPEKV